MLIWRYNHCCTLHDWPSASPVLDLIMLTWKYNHCCTLHDWPSASPVLDLIMLIWKYNCCCTLHDWFSAPLCHGWSDTHGLYQLLWLINFIWMMLFIFSAIVCPYQNYQKYSQYYTYFPLHHNSLAVILLSICHWMTNIHLLTEVTCTITMMLPIHPI